MDNKPHLENEIDKIETDLIKNLNFCMSNFGDMALNISIAGYKKYL